jgi:hypothetical protein
MTAASKILFLILWIQMFSSVCRNTLYWALSLNSTNSRNSFGAPSLPNSVQRKLTFLHCRRLLKENRKFEEGRYGSTAFCKPEEHDRMRVRSSCDVMSPSTLVDLDNTPPKIPPEGCSSQAAPRYAASLSRCNFFPRMSLHPVEHVVDEGNYLV